jgi:hypothetical protein
VANGPLITIQFNSIQFIEYLLKCRLNSTIANYKSSTKTQIKHKHSTNTQKLDTRETEQKQVCRKATIMIILSEGNSVVKEHALIKRNLISPLKYKVGVAKFQKNAKYINSTC